MRRTLHRMRQIDRAWNERNWDSYASFLADELVVRTNGKESPYGKQEHIAKLRSFCTDFPDSYVHIDPYVALFANYDGATSCSVVRITGTTTEDLTMSAEMMRAVVEHAFDVTLIRICRWRGNRIVEQREFLDRELMLRQLRGIPQAALNFSTISE